MDKYALINELFNLSHELEIRKSNNFKYSWTKYQELSSDEIYNRIILIAAKLRTQKEVDLELCHKDSHYSYCNTVYDLIEDALYVESLPDEED